jgi:hypothetical protein
MAYKSNEKITLLETISLSETLELRVSRVEDESGEFKSVDIRNWYCTTKDPEMKPTQKGVRIKKENIQEIVDLLTNQLSQ